MAQAYTSPDWSSGEGISPSNLQSISNTLEGIVQGTDKAIHNISINGSNLVVIYVDGTTETFTITGTKGIAEVTKTSSGNVDTYTIVFTDGTTYSFEVTSGGSSVIANPTLSGGEADLTALEVDGTKYKISGGGSASIDYGDETAFNEWSANAQNGEIFVRTDDNEGGGSFAPKFEYTREGITIITPGITISGGGYYEWGNVVVVNLNVDITAAANGYTFNGFPKAVVSTNINPIITTINGGNTYPSLWGFINTSGQMQMRVNPASTDLLVGKKAVITAQYLKAE